MIATLEPKTSAKTWHWKGKPNQNHRNFRGSRILPQAFVFNVPLFLELQFLERTTVVQIESQNEAPRAIVAFCHCIQNQTGGSIVAQAAANVNATLSVAENFQCQVIDTSRQYSIEADNLFGPGYVSLQLHVVQNVSIISEQPMSLESVVALVTSGYEISTGGRREFIKCLNQNDEFGSVLSVEMRRGLSANATFPSWTPTEATLATTVGPTTTPTAFPVTGAPTPQPTETSSLSPTLEPSIRPSRSISMSPTRTPSKIPSLFPSSSPSTAPSHVPSIDMVETPPTLNPGITLPTWTPWGNWSSPDTTPAGAPSIKSPTNALPNDRPLESAPVSDPLVIAAIAGATATVIVSSIFAACIWWRRIKKIPQRRSKPKYALTSRDAQLGKFDPDDKIPGFVELDQRSLAETSLGDRTAGRPKPKSANAHPKRIESFDEHSLYTTPFSVQQTDEVTSYHRTHSGPTILASQVMRHTEVDEKILLPLSDSTTSSSDGLSSFGPTSSRPLTDEIPFEANRHIKYNVPPNVKPPTEASTVGHHRHIGRRLEAYFDRATEQGKATSVTKTIDEGNTANDIDTWSCGFEDFDKGSDFYNKEATSRSPSHSSRSTAKVTNLSNPKHTASRKPSFNGNATYMEVKKGRQSASGEPIIAESKRPPTPIAKSKRPPTPWSSWDSMIFSAKHEGKDSKGTESDYPSSLLKLLDSVTQAVSPLQATTRSIPVVTPEENESDIGQPTDTSLSREDDSTLLGLQFKDDTSSSSASTATSPNPWLLEKLEESLGPKSTTADMESLSGKSNISMRSPGKASRTGAESMVSIGSHKSYRSGFTQNEVAFAPRTLEHDLKRLERQLAALDNVSTSSAGVSSITGISMTKSPSISSRSRGTSTKISPKKRIVVIVPPGKLGVILANRHDGKGTVVSEIRKSSPLYRMLSPGDKLIGIDNDDVTKMVVSQITSLMASRADRERRLTIITSAAQQFNE